jgi:hypothetical protein
LLIKEAPSGAISLVPQAETGFSIGVLLLATSGGNPSIGIMSSNFPETIHQKLLLIKSVIKILVVGERGEKFYRIMVMEGLASLCNERDCAVEMERVMLADPIEHFFEELIDFFLGSILCGFF